jgi:hypothetical protein
MSDIARPDLLQRALAISRELSQLAEAGDIAMALALDRQRRELLRVARPGRGSHEALGERERAMVAEIASLNDRALGALEHRLRIKARELDMAAVGRRAVAAYAATG